MAVAMQTVHGFSTCVLLRLCFLDFKSAQQYISNDMHVMPCFLGQKGKTRSMLRGRSEVKLTDEHNYALSKALATGLQLFSDGTCSSSVVKAHLTNLGVCVCV